MDNEKFIVENEDEAATHLGKQINTIEWLPLLKSSSESRSEEEYYGIGNNGNVVIGCENNGVYLYSLHQE